MLAISISLEKSNPLYKKGLNVFRSDTYWKERIVGSVGFIMYFLGNILEIFSSPHPSIYATSDPPALWITGALLSIGLVIITLTPYRRYTPALFIATMYFVNFNIILSYLSSTIKYSDSLKNGEHINLEPSIYLFTSYFIFFVSSQMLESRRELLTITVCEILFFACGVYYCREYKPSLLDPNQQLLFMFVMIGNIIVGLLRMRLTQISGDSSIQFKTISENARDIQCIVDRNFNFVYINPAVKEISGLGFSDLSGKNFSSLVIETDQQAVLASLEALRQSPEEKQSAEYRIKTTSGKYIWVESIFSSFKMNRQGKTELIFAETRNIENRKMLEEEIQRQLRMEEMLIKHSNQFINVGRAEIQQGIDVALGEFGSMLQADALMVYRMHGKLQDEFRSTNQWVSKDGASVTPHFNLSIKINQQLVQFLRSLRGNKTAHGKFFNAEQLFEILALNTKELPGKRFFLVSLQSGNIVNGFVVFVFDEKAQQAPLSIFGLTGNMVSSAFTRMRTELRLHEAQLTNEAILRALPDWLYIINKNGEFTGTNNYSTLPDYIPDYGLIGKTFGDVLSGEIGDKFSSTLAEVIDSDMAASFEYQDSHIYKGRNFKTIIAPFKANEYLVIIRDISDLKKAQNELLSKAKKLEQSNKELEEFAYVVSHDMKQPIRTIISYLSLLKKKHTEALPPEAQEFVNYSIEGANKMSDLIRDILQYSRLDQEITLAKGVSIQSIMQKVRKNINDSIVSNNAEVFYDELPAVTGNETMLMELFQNLTENGIKYNLSKEKKVRISATDKGNEWLFEIQDNGIGFEQQYAQQIFKIFKRLHTDGEFQGTGIGLTICQKVVEKHGGKIWAESEKGVGSHFFFTLPK